MNVTFFILQFISGIFSLYNKFLISSWMRKISVGTLKQIFPDYLTTRSFGWMSGIIGVILSTIYFLVKPQNFEVMKVYNYALFILLLYGYLISKAEESNNLKTTKFLKKWEMELKILVITITAIACRDILIQEKPSSIVSTQFYTAVTGLIGTLLLSLKKDSLGWFLYFVTHLLSAYAMYQTDSFVISAFQGISSVIAFFGIFYRETENSPVPVE